MSAQTAVGCETEVTLIHPGIEPFVGLGAGGLSLRRTPRVGGGKGCVGAPMVAGAHVTYDPVKLEKSF